MYVSIGSNLFTSIYNNVTLKQQKRLYITLLHTTLLNYLLFYGIHEVDG